MSCLVTKKLGLLCHFNMAETEFYPTMLPFVKLTVQYITLPMTEKTYFKKWRCISQQESTIPGLRNITNSKAYFGFLRETPLSILNSSLFAWKHCIRVWLTFTLYGYGSGGCSKKIENLLKFTSISRVSQCLAYLKKKNLLVTDKRWKTTTNVPTNR